MAEALFEGQRVRSGLVRLGGFFRGLLPDESPVRTGDDIVPSNVAKIITTRLRNSVAEIFGKDPYKNGFTVSDVYNNTGLPFVWNCDVDLSRDPRTRDNYHLVVNALWELVRAGVLRMEQMQDSCGLGRCWSDINHDTSHYFVEFYDLLDSVADGRMTVQDLIAQRRH